MSQISEPAGSTLVDPFVFKGNIDASSNPNYPAADAGDTYKITVAGKIGGASGTQVYPGYTIYCSVDGSAAGTQAAVGANWTVIGSPNVQALQIACSDETTDLTTGNAKVTFRMPFGMNLTEVRASVTTAPTGSTIIVDINDSGTTIMAVTKLSIDASEKTSTTAAAPAVLSDTVLADDAEVTIDIDQVGSTIAGKGLKVTLIGSKI